MNTGRTRATPGTWNRLWGDLTRAPDFYRERQQQPLELALVVAEPVLSIALATLLVVGIGAFMMQLIPNASLAGLAPLAALTAIIGYFYGRRLQWSGIIVREWVVFLLPLLVLWRIVTLFTLGRGLGATLQSWLADPASFLDPAFLIGGALLIAAWAQALGYGRDLANLHPALDELQERPAIGSAAYWSSEERRDVATGPALTAIAGRWLRGGIILAILSAIGAAGVHTLLNGRTLLRLVSFGAPDESAALPNVLAYMLCGLVLTSLAQLSRLRATWASDGVDAMPGLPRRVLLAMGALVAIALIIAFVLPTRYAIGLGDLLQSIIGAVMYGVAAVMGAIFTLMTLLLSPLAALFHIHTTHPHTPPPAFHPPPAAARHGGGDILRSLLFWGVALAVLLYCALVLFKQAQGRVPALAMLGRIARLLWLRLGAAMGLLFGLLRRGATGVAAVARRLAGEGARASARMPLGRPSLRHAGPRERVALLYLSIEERARRLGLPRRSGQTASEYSRRLREEMPDLDPDLAGLTDLFLEARYSPHPFDDENALSARTLWQRVRARLRLRRSSQ